MIITGLELQFLLLFIDQEITFECLQALRKDLIAELIPKLGPRNEFITNWEREFGLTAVTDQKKKRNRSDGLPVRIRFIIIRQHVNTVQQIKGFWDFEIEREIFVAIT